MTIPPVEDRAVRSCADCMIDESLCYNLYGERIGGCKYNITIHEYRDLIDSGVIP